MSKPFIHKGDLTSHGGMVIEASGESDTNGIGIARVGDRVLCPKSGHRDVVIATGDPDVIIDGKPAARDGDLTSCGAVLIASQTLTTRG